MIRRWLATTSTALLLLLMLAANAGADLERGYQAYQNGDYQAAIEAWRPLAEQGDSVAQFNLGQMYRLGKGVVQNDREAVKWYLLAAQQGSTYARHNIKLMYRDGRITDDEYQQAFVEPAAGAPAGVEPAADIAAAAEAATDTATDAAAAVTADTRDTPAAAPATAAANSDAATLAAAPPRPSTATDGRAWLQQLDPKTYVVQLMATPEAEPLQAFLAKNPLTPADRSGVVRTQSRGSDWYVLLLGPYDDRSAASAAVDELPDVFKKNKPWIRQVSSVQATAKQ